MRVEDIIGESNWFARATTGEKAPDRLVQRENAMPDPLRNFFGDRAIKGCAITAPESKPSLNILGLGQPHGQFCRHHSRSSLLEFDNISLDRLKGARYLCPQGAAASARSGREVDVSAEIAIRPFADDDAPQVRKLFIVINRLLSPPDLRDAFEAYIERALAGQIDRINADYGERNGGFWVAIENDKLVGTFGLERASPDAMELRRIYVDPGARRRGIARQMLRFAEDEYRRRKIRKLELSTSELQNAAITFYKNAGYRLVYEDLAQTGSNKTVGSGFGGFILTNLCDDQLF